jgi:hypothetical protein
VVADQAVESEALARRRRAVLMLRITASVCLATAARLADGASPVEAREAARVAAGDLAAAAAALRRLAGRPPVHANGYARAAQKGV